MIIAHTDPELLDWLLGIVNGVPTKAGDFLTEIAIAALRADHENYPLLRPCLLELRAKYPEYNFPEDAFHKHLDRCEQCREHPFELCQTGSLLLSKADPEL